MDTVSQIKQKLDIADVIGGYISLKKAGKNYKSPCPFHSEDTPSFMVSPDLQIYKCFGCGEGGDMFNFVEKIEGIDFSAALELLADKAGVEVEKRNFDSNYKKKTTVFNINQTASDFYHHILTTHKVGKKGLEYLKKKRNLDNKTIEAFKLGYAPDTWDTIDRFLEKKGYKGEDALLSGVVSKKRSGDGFIDKFRGRIIFPFIDVSGKIVGFNGRDVVGRDPKYLNTQETLVFNKSAFLYGLDKAKVDMKNNGAILVEGQMDVITAHKNGIKNAVASSGTSITTTQLKMLSRYTNELVLCFDSDSAGITATTRALSLINQFDFDVKVAMIPEEYDDLDDFLNKDLKKAKKVLKNPVPVYDFFLATALKNFDKKTAYGKKGIVDYLAPVYSKITNTVVLDHYVKTLAEELDIDEGVVRDSIKNPQKADFEQAERAATEKFQSKIKKVAEDYLVALLLKSDLDTMGQFLYKLRLKDFSVDKNKEIFSKLKKYIDSKPSKFDIKYFTETLEEEFREVALEMFLWDFGDLVSGEDKIVQELQATISRVEKDSTKRELKELTEQIKLAELEKNTEKVESLSKKFTKISQKLL